MRKHLLICSLLATPAFAADPEVSLVAAQARSFPVADQRSEAAVALKPDLVLVGSLDRSALRRVLADLGLRVHEVGLVADLDHARAQVRDVAALLGHPERGEALAASPRPRARRKAMAASCRWSGCW